MGAYVGGRHPTLVDIIRAHRRLTHATHESSTVTSFAIEILEGWMGDDVEQPPPPENVSK